MRVLKQILGIIIFCIFFSLICAFQCGASGRSYFWLPDAVVFASAYVAMRRPDGLIFGIRMTAFLCMLTWPWAIRMDLIMSSGRVTYRYISRVSLLRHTTHPFDTLFFSCFCAFWSLFLTIFRHLFSYSALFHISGILFVQYFQFLTI
jgi:hypothetical protein